MMKNIILIICVVIFTSCSKNYFALPSQDLNNYESNEFYINKEVSQKLKENYLKNLFYVWGIDKTNINMKNIANDILKDTGYGENYQLNSQKLMQNIVDNADFDNLNKISKNAIIIHSSNLRLLPTKKPRFKNPKLAGEGYPFDYLQNSFIYAYTPVKISHFSKDFGWSFIYNSVVVGFIENKNIAFISDEDLNIYKSSKDFIMPKKDKIALIDKNDDFIEYARIGMPLALSKESANFYTIRVFKKDLNNNAKLIEIKVKKEDFFKLGDSFSSVDLKKIANELIGQNYGWGGLNGDRDCSAFLKDVFGTFGVFLARNSQDQIYQKDYLNRKIFFNISKLSNKQKYNYIKSNAIPFATLLALKGHIVLYLGEFDNKIYILHNLWGIKNYERGVESRIIVGKVAITTIDAGKNLSSVKEQDVILSRIFGMRNLFADELQFEIPNLNSNKD
ncbi:SH3 domain-containing C40 family peptidase [Campylobacter sp. 2018MI27]|uniref:SH3 domain-containing C40 family peptidase n=2 Tax=unclassified Campylobacter TaxID=2593542 RepID=UPI001BDAD58D|nr:SH3 domain-containing C40 family peptidase [Campylobacter sp. 2018MI27]MBT0880464.1 SH3 domain-containing protein [Campylobacter sp. 2018MI27]